MYTRVSLGSDKPFECTCTGGGPTVGEISRIDVVDGYRVEKVAIEKVDKKKLWSFTSTDETKALFDPKPHLCLS